MYRRIAVAAVAAVVAAGTGAGCRPGERAAAPSPAPAAADATAARAALAASTAKTTGSPVRMRMDMRMAGLTMTMAGSVDVAGRKMAATTAVRGPARMDMEMRLDGDRAYLRSPMTKDMGAGKPWVAVDMAAAAKVPGMEQLNDPHRALAGDFAQAVVDVARDGATGFRGTVDFTRTENGKQWVKDIPGGAQRLTAVPFTATVDGEGRLATLVITEQSIPLRMNVSYSDFGVPVVVTAPPAAQTHDLAGGLAGVAG